MKVKVSEAIGPVLDWMVDQAEGLDVLLPAQDALLHRSYSTDGSLGMRILDREGISLRPIRKPGHPLHGQWLAAIDHGNTGTMVKWVKRQDFARHYWQGPDMLAAGLRCYVASKLGCEVEVPDELLQQDQVDCGSTAMPRKRHR